MIKNEIQVTIEKLIPGGDGLARLDGQAVFIPGVLPGERVKAVVVEQKKGWMKTGVPEILEASPDRQTPFCPLFDECGGCSWQHIAYDVQLESKASFSREALIRQGGFSDDEIPDFRIISSPPESYRSRIRPTILSDGKAGFHSTGSNRIVPVPFCPVATPGVNRFLSTPPDELKNGANPVVFGDNRDFWTAGINPEARVVIKSKAFTFPPEAFFQSNMYPLADLIDFALNDAESTGNSCAMDLYGGVGLFGAFLADRFEAVVGVDRDKRTRKYWKQHVGKSGTFHPVSLEDYTRRKIEPKPDFIIVDPPRTGLSPSIRKVLSRLKVPQISYVSCNPVTQARDIKELRSAGYKLTDYGVFDLSPQTAHVETVARLAI